MFSFFFILENNDRMPLPSNCLIEMYFKRGFFGAKQSEPNHHCYVLQNQGVYFLVSQEMHR